MVSLGFFSEEIDPDNFIFHWPGRTKMQQIRQSILKEGNVNHRYLMCPELWSNNFEVIVAAISLNKVDLGCKDILIAKHTSDYSGFIN